MHVCSFHSTEFPIYWLNIVHLIPRLVSLISVEIMFIALWRCNTILICIRTGLDALATWSYSHQLIIIKLNQTIYSSCSCWCIYMSFLTSIKLKTSCSFSEPWRYLQNDFINSASVSNSNVSLRIEMAVMHGIKFNAYGRDLRCFINGQ